MASPAPSPPEALRLSEGAMVSDAYRVERLIGTGTMGAVYAVTEIATGARRALKVMSAKLLADPQALHRFEREARLGRRIRSEGVVHTLEAGTDPATGLQWIAMEHVEGQPLDDWLASGPSPAQRRSAIQQLLRAVAAAHAAGVVHRDLEPRNVLVVERADATGRRALKVLDFGVAKALSSATAASTQAGLGTPTWAAPEQAEPGHLPAPTADVWSLGLLVFRLLTGKHYWLSSNREASLADAAAEVGRGAAEPASKRAVAVGYEGPIPAGFDAWFARCVTRDPTRRFRNGGEALDALGPVLGLVARRRGPWAMVRNLRQASPLQKLVGTLVLLAVLVAAVWALLLAIAAYYR